MGGGREGAFQTDGAARTKACDGMSLAHERQPAGPKMPEQPGEGGGGHEVRCPGSPWDFLLLHQKPESSLKHGRQA